MTKLKILLIIIFSGGIVVAQTFNAKSLSMANNMIAFNSGADALMFNPANLAIKESRVELSFLSFYSAISNSSISIADYNQYFTHEGHGGKAWDTSDKNAILDLIPKEGLGVNTNIRMNVMALAFNNMGFSIDVIGNGRVQVKSREALKLMFDLDLTDDFTFDKPEIASGSFYAATKYSFAYAQKIDTDFGLYDLKDFAVAAKVSFIAGHAVYDITDSHVFFERSSENGLADKDLGYYKLDLNARRAYPEGGISAGSGFGFDLAASANYDKKWTFSMALENLFAAINWNTNTAEVNLFKSDSVYFFKEDDGVDRSVETDTTIERGSFSTSLPLNLYMGASYQLMEELVLTAQWKQGLTEDFGNSVTPQVGVGAEYRPLRWLPLRSGMTVGGRNQFLLGLGTGVDFPGFEFNISYAMREALWPTYSNGAYAAFDFKVGF